MIKNKITVKQILEDKYIYFKNKYWYKIPKRMRHSHQANIAKICFMI